MELVNVSRALGVQPPQDMNIIIIYGGPLALYSSGRYQYVYEGIVISLYSTATQNYWHWCFALGQPPNTKIRVGNTNSLVSKNAKICVTPMRVSGIKVVLGPQRKILAGHVDFMLFIQVFFLVGYPTRMLFSVEYKPLKQSGCCFRFTFIYIFLFFLFFHRSNSALNRRSSIEILLDHWATFCRGPPNVRFSFLAAAGFEPNICETENW